MATKKTTRKKAEPTATLDPREPIAPTAKALEQVLAEVRAVLGKLTPPAEPQRGDLIDAVVHFVFAEGVPCGVGQEVVRRTHDAFVDRNEFRVTEAFEVADLLADLEIPGLFERCMTVREAVAQIYNDQNAVSLEALREASVSDRNSFFQRVPALSPAVQRSLNGLLAFEECVFSDRSTLRVQTRLGFDPKAAAAQGFFEGLREVMAPWGHVPLQVGSDAPRGKPPGKPELCPACALIRLSPARKR